VFPDLSVASVPSGVTFSGSAGEAETVSDAASVVSTTVSVVTFAFSVVFPHPVRRESTKTDASKSDNAFFFIFICGVSPYIIIFPTVRYNITNEI